MAFARSRISIVLKTLVALLILLFGYGIVMRYVDYRGVSGRAASAEAAYRAAGWPWVAEDLRLEPVAAEANAVPLFQEIHQLLNDPDVQALLKRVTQLPRRHTDVSERRWVEAEMRKLKPILDLVRAAAERPHAAFSHDWDRAFALEFDEVIAVREAAKLLVVEALLSAHAGQPQKAANALRATRRLAAHAGADFSLTPMLASVAIEKIGAYGSELVLSIFRGNEAALRLITDLYAEEPNLSIERFFRGEAYLLLASLRNVQPSRTGIITLRELDAEVDEQNLRRDGWPESQAAQALMVRHLETWVQIREHIQAAGDDAMRLAHMIESLSEQAQIDTSASNLTNREMLRHYPRALWGATEGRAAILTIHTLGRVMIFEARHGRFIQSLAELGEVPTDPFDNQPLRYWHRNGAVRVYALGPNLKDGGGLDRREMPRDPNVPREFQGDSTFGYPPVVPVARDP
jgi:hypothetical protein